MGLCEGLALLNSPYRRKHFTQPHFLIPHNKYDYQTTINLHRKP